MKHSNESNPLAILTGIDPVKAILKQVQATHDMGQFGVCMAALGEVALSTRHLETACTVSEKAVYLRAVHMPETMHFFERTGAQFLFQRIKDAGDQKCEAAASALDQIAAKAQEDPGTALPLWRKLYVGAILIIPHIVDSGNPHGLRRAMNQIASTLDLREGAITHRIFAHLKGMKPDSSAPAEDLPSGGVPAGQAMRARPTSEIRPTG